MTRRLISCFGLAVPLLAALVSTPHDIASLDRKPTPVWQPEMSPMAKIAWGLEPAPEVSDVTEAPTPTSPPERALGFQGGDVLVHSPTAPEFQSSTTIAVNGDQVVVGFNDMRGASFVPPSFSGFAYSSDDGDTWTDGPVLPTAGGDGVFGDPDIKTWTSATGIRYFVYASLYQTAAHQNSLCVHLSTNGGAAWSGPREVTPARTLDFPDKEFIDIDPETGRLFISWTHFPSVGAPTIRTCYSDDFGATWLPATLTIFPSEGQGSVPRAAGNSDNVYICWRAGADIMLATSVNNGVTWGAPVSIATGLFDPMNPYGSDRIHGLPSMAVDETTGNVYVVYAARASLPDFSEVFFTRSTNGGVSWSTPVAINMVPGQDRSQFFPWICDDPTGGTISVLWYDQINGTGADDITEVLHTHSTDQGLTWSCPAPLTDRPFHAEAGNRLNEANLGDYIQAVHFNQKLYACFAKTDRPSPLTFSPDTYVDISPDTPNAVPISYVSLTIFPDSNFTGCATSGGYWEPGARLDLRVTIKNFGDCGPITGITGTLSCTSPYVAIISATRSFGDLGAWRGSTSSNALAFVLALDPSTPCGTLLTFEVTLTSSSGNAVVAFDQPVGWPVRTRLLLEHFAGSPPALPPGWTTSTLAGGANPWVTGVDGRGRHFAYCADVSFTSLNELSSPAIAIPAGTDIVIVNVLESHDMEVDTERRAWDGALMRILVGNTRYLSGAIGIMKPFYPWQMNRQSSVNQPLQDLSCWSGSNAPPCPVSCTMSYNDSIPDLGGQTIKVLVDVSTDALVGGGGIAVKEVYVDAIDYECSCAGPPALAVDPSSINFGSVPVNTTASRTVTLTNIGASQLVISSISGCSDATFTLDASMTDLTLDPSQSTSLVVNATPTEPGAPGCTIQVSSNDPAGPKLIHVRIDMVTAARDVPARFGVMGAVPNPFNPETAIRFTLPSRMNVTVEIWDVSGARVRVLTREQMFDAGANEVRWNGVNDRGEPVSSGVYFVRVRTRAGEKAIRAVLLK